MKARLCHKIPAAPHLIPLHSLLGHRPKLLIMLSSERSGYPASLLSVVVAALACTSASAQQTVEVNGNGHLGRYQCTGVWWC